MFDISHFINLSAHVNMQSASPLQLTNFEFVGYVSGLIGLVVTFALDAWRKRSGR